MTSYQTSHNYIHRQIACQDVLISVGGNIARFDGYVQLNAAAAAIWKFLSAPKSAAEVEKMLMEQYQISAEEARADTAEFLQQMREHDMIVVHDDGV